MLRVRFANGLRMLSEDSDQTQFVISRRFVHRAYIIINNNLISKNEKLKYLDYIKKREINASYSCDIVEI